MLPCEFGEAQPANIQLKLDPLTAKLRSFRDLINVCDCIFHWPSSYQSSTNIKIASHYSINSVYKLVEIA